MNPLLSSLLINLDGLSDEEAEYIVFEKYVELYLERGSPPRRMGSKISHDGTAVLFTESRFDHAFFTSSDKTSRRYVRDMFVRLRGGRVAWIGPVIAGQIPGSECWVIPPKNGRRDVRNRPPNRFYLVPEERYVVWLEPAQDGGWWFSSCYVAGLTDVKRYCRDGRRIWAQKISRD